MAMFLMFSSACDRADALALSRGADEEPCCPTGEFSVRDSALNTFRIRSGVLWRPRVISRMEKSCQ